ncbi:MAG TPA: site-specific DNA-methyltransferase, partial [Rubrobacteraceae bacterium]|nr:site-specific DNA-methyltransferase [Rubrobacteraceae bacterium]
MPELDWIGKHLVLDLAGKVPVHPLRSVEQISLHPGSGNKVVHGDNLQALKALLPHCRERVKLVFIDPPYNADDERWIYADYGYKAELEPLLGEVGREGEDTLRHDKWLCMMYPRLVLLRELLAPDGSIFISIGDNELPRLRLVMDEVFGARNFLGCAVWEKGPPAH